jgi:hypothetical protein
MTTPKDLQVTIGGVTVEPIDRADVADVFLPDSGEETFRAALAVARAKSLGDLYLPSRTHDIDRPCHVIDIEADEDWGKDLPTTFEPTMRIDPIDDDEYFELDGVRGHDCPVIAVGSKNLILKWRAETTWHWVRSNRSGGWIADRLTAGHADYVCGDDRCGA